MVGDSRGSECAFPRTRTRVFTHADACERRSMEEGRR
ncbi:hypothetical protein HRbin10_00092 [bacterium HR10]|nr:hypothetical protein HRbin10_00092 [bacterium HR10]